MIIEHLGMERGFSCFRILEVASFFGPYVGDHVGFWESTSPLWTLKLLGGKCFEAFNPGEW